MCKNAANSVLPRRQTHCLLPFLHSLSLISTISYVANTNGNHVISISNGKHILRSLLCALRLVLRMWSCQLLDLSLPTQTGLDSLAIEIDAMSFKRTSFTFLMIYFLSWPHGVMSIRSNWSNKDAVPILCSHFRVSISPFVLLCAFSSLPTSNLFLPTATLSPLIPSFPFVSLLPIHTNPQLPTAHPANATIPP